eukprot:14825375-Ditylum_brightwellii.AAC.1
MQEKLRGMPNFADFDGQRDVILLQAAIKSIMHRFDHRKDQYMSVVDAIIRFANLYQGRDMSNQTFYEKFKAMQTILDEHGANIASHPALELIELSDRDDYSAEEIAEQKEKSKEKFLARYFLRK